MRRGVVMIAVLAGCLGVGAWATWRGKEGGSFRFEEMSPDDRQRLGELVLQLSHNPEELNETIHHQFWEILDRNRSASPPDFLLLKRRMENLFYLPKLFWEDARQTLQRQKPFKSKRRDQIEKKLVEEGFLSPPRVQADDAIMEKLSHGDPIMSNHGVEIIVDEQMVTEILTSWDEREIQRAMLTLFTR